MTMTKEEFEEKFDELIQELELQHAIRMCCIDKKIKLNN